MIKRTNKRGLVPIAIIAIILLIVIAFYLIIAINPFGAFTNIKATINYFLILIIFVAMQVGIIFGYYELAKFGVKGFKFIRKKIIDLTGSFKRYLVMRF